MNAVTPATYCARLLKRTRADVAGAIAEAVERRDEGEDSSVVAGSFTGSPASTTQIPQASPIHGRRVAGRRHTSLTAIGRARVCHAARHGSRRGVDVAHDTPTCVDRGGHDALLRP